MCLTGEVCLRLPCGSSEQRLQRLCRNFKPSCKYINLSKIGDHYTVYIVNLIKKVSCAIVHACLVISDCSRLMER